jgi:hypothetical protein
MAGIMNSANGKHKTVAGARERGQCSVGKVGRIDGRLILKASGERSELAKPFIQPIFVPAASLIALAPFRYLWNNPPRFVGKNFWLALFTPVVVYIVIALGLSYLMTVCWRLWKSD